MMELKWIFLLMKGKKITFSIFFAGMNYCFSVSIGKPSMQIFEAHQLNYEKRLRNLGNAANQSSLIHKQEKIIIISVRMKH